MGTKNRPLCHSQEYFTPFTKIILYIYPLKFYHIERKAIQFSLTSNKLQLSVSNAFDRSINSASTFQQGISYCKKFHNKHGFSIWLIVELPNLFPKYLMEYQNVKVMKSKFKNEKSNKNKHKKQCSFKRKREKKSSNQT